MIVLIERICKNCFFRYCRDLEDDICFQEGGCKGFSPIGLRLEDLNDKENGR